MKQNLIKASTFGFLHENNNNNLMIAARFSL
jgi:hypothetical protein